MVLVGPVTTGRPGLAAGPDPELSDLFLTRARDGWSELVSRASTTPCSTVPAETVPMALALLVVSSSSLAEVGTGGCFFLALDEEWWTILVLDLLFGGVSWLRDESYVGLCWEVRRRPPGGGLPSASLRCFSNPNHGEASVDLVKFGVWNLDCTMIWVGPMATGRSGLMGGPEASPDRPEGPDTTLSDLFLIMSRAGWPMLVL